MTIVLPEGMGDDSKDQSEEKSIEINYEATEQDEENFFLMYHMSFQPSEVEKLDAEYRKWLIARFMAQKNMEREAMERNRFAMQEHQRILSEIGPNLKT